MGRLFLFVLVELCGLALIAAWMIDKEASYAQGCLGGGIGLVVIGNIGIVMVLWDRMQRASRLRNGQCPNCGRDHSGMTSRCAFCDELVAA
jgi:hypothetical protein